MKRFLIPILLSAVLLPTAFAQDLAVRGDIVHTLAAESIENGIVLIRDGRIAEVGPTGEVTLPDGVQVVEGAVVTPGLVDAHSVVGLSGIHNVDHDQDQLDTSAPLQPELRAIDAYNPREALVDWVRRLGVTTLHTGHGPGALISGQTVVVKTVGETVDEALLDPDREVAMVAFTLGPEVEDHFESPGTRAKGAAMLRGKLVEAQEYRRKRQAQDESKRPDKNLGLEMLVRVLDGEVPALVTAQRVPEILTALRLARELDFRLILDGAAEAYLVVDEIHEAGVPVILHPPMVRAGGETRNASFETAAKLARAGILFAFQSGFEAYVPKTRVILFEAAVAAAHGLSFEEALAAISRDAARILGIDDRVGTLEAGKDADLVVFDGDPFETGSHVCTVVVDGRVVSDECR